MSLLKDVIRRIASNRSVALSAEQLDELTLHILGIIYAELEVFKP